MLFYCLFVLDLTHPKIYISEHNNKSVLKVKINDLSKLDGCIIGSKVAGREHKLNSFIFIDDLEYYCRKVLSLYSPYL